MRRLPFRPVALRHRLSPAVPLSVQSSVREPHRVFISPEQNYKQNLNGLQGKFSAISEILMPIICANITKPSKRLFISARYAQKAGDGSFPSPAFSQFSLFLSHLQYWRSSLHRRSASCSLWATIATESLPEMQPSISGSFIASMAAPAASASPGSVLSSTTMPA